MSTIRLRWGAVLLTVLLVAALEHAPARAALGPGDELLKKHGLRLAGSLAVATEEAEVKTKVIDARRLSKQLNYAIAQQKGTLSPQEQQQQVKTISDQIGQLRSELNVASQQMNAIPRYRGRFMSNDASQLYAQLTYYRNQLQMEINEDTAYVNQLKNQPADPKAKERAEADVRDRREAYHQAILELRKLIDAADAKYEDAATNEEVTKALGLLGKGQREQPKLGPSHDFLANVKLVEKLEKAEESGGADEPQAKPTKRNRGKTKVKSSLKAARGNSDGAS